MNNKLQLVQKVRFRRIVLLCTFSLFVAGATTILLEFGTPQKAHAVSATESISTGSFIVNMGITPQTVANGLKPYGLVYDLVTNYQVPVKWVISTTKLRDGIDFSHNGVDYKGGTFIIPAEFIDATINGRIAYWQTLGVQGDYSVSTLSVPVNSTINSFPLIMIDTSSSLQAIIMAYFTNAEIPSSAYTLGVPAGLTGCIDVWANPHGDPTWTTHSYLKNFVTVQKSWIWAECHAVSMMEYCKSTIAPIQQLNFLSTAGLKCWGANKCGTNPEIHVKNASSPYNYYYPNDPIMQFMGNMHAACTAGSEQWYQPVSTGQWNANTKRGVTTGNGSAPNEGTVLVYGPAYGDPANGMVMYEGGHSLDSGGANIADRVAGQRAFFNYLLMAGVAKQLGLTASVPSYTSSGMTIPITSQASLGTPGYNYLWSSALGAAFGQSTDSVTTYTAPVVVNDTTDIVKLIVTDQCGRQRVFYQTIFIGGSATLPVSLIQFKALYDGSTVHLNWTTSSEINNDRFIISRSADGYTFNRIGQVRGNGTVSHTSEYTFEDIKPISGRSYYQLSQFDFDGHSEIFPPVVVNIKDLHPGKIVSYPFPFRDNVNVIYESGIDEEIVISLFDMQGKRVLESTHMVVNGSNTLNINAKSLTAGMYAVFIHSSKGNTAYGKIIKE
jgi:hypothetical protein